MNEVSKERLEYHTRNANPDWDVDSLTRIVEGVDVDWHIGYANSPSIIINLKEGVSKNTLTPTLGGAMMALEIPVEESDKGSHYYYCAGPEGFVRYFTHSGTEGVDEGGFAGAVFEVILPYKTKCLQGPWSSRATCVNMEVEEKDRIVDVVVRSTPHSGGGLAIAIKEAALLHLLRLHNFPFPVIRRKDGRAGGEKDSWTVSLKANRAMKPHREDDLKDCWDFEKGTTRFDVLYSPEVMPL